MSQNFNQKQIKWGILGTSYISEVMAKAIHESNMSQLIAIGSRSMITAKKFADIFQIPKIYDDYQALLNDKEIDAVYIALPNHLHKEWIIRAARAGKHILCEKPLVISVSEANEVMNCVKQSNIFCMEALMYKFHPFTKKIQELIHSKIIGKIKLYTATYTANIAKLANPIAGGSINNLGCYPVSLVRLLANSEPIEICGQGRLDPKHNHLAAQASIILKFPDDSMAVISTADDLEMFWQFDIYGTEGNLKILTNPWLPCYDNKLLIYRDNENIPTEININAEKSLYTYQIDHLNRSLLSQDIPAQAARLLSDSLGNTIVLETWLKQVQIKVNVEYTA